MLTPFPIKRGSTRPRKGGQPALKKGVNRNALTRENLIAGLYVRLIPLSPALALIADRLPTATSAEREKIFDRIKPRARDLMPYLRSIPPADLAAMLDELRASGRGTGNGNSFLPPWCGDRLCNPITRRRETPDGDDAGPCPSCSRARVQTGTRGASLPIEREACRALAGRAGGAPSAFGAA